MPTCCLIDPPRLGGGAPAPEVTLGHVVAVGAQSGSTWTNSTHDLAADDDMVLILVEGRQNTAPTSVTYGGVTTTPWEDYVETVPTPDNRVQAFYLLAADLPAAGDNKAAVVNWGTLTRGAYQVIALKGVAQEAPAQTNGANGTATSTAASAVTVAQGSAVFQAVYRDGTEEATEGGGETLISKGSEPLNADYFLASYKLNQNGTVDMAATWTTSQEYAKGVWAVEPA